MSPGDRLAASAQELVRRTCAAQRLPERVEDPAVLVKVAQLVRPRNGNGASKGPITTSYLTTTATADGGAQCLR